MFHLCLAHTCNVKEMLQVKFHQNSEYNLVITVGP